MKKTIILELAMMGGVFLASCTVNRTMSYVTTIDTNNYEVEVTPMMATLEVGTSHTSGKFSWEGKKNERVNYDELRDNAIYNALQKLSADVLITPQYQVVTSIRGSRKYIEITVTGYPAKYVNFTPCPQPGELEVRELKNDANYMILSKDSEGNSCGYQIVVPYDKDVRTIDLDQTTVDKIILDGNKASITPKKAARRVDTAQPKTFIDKLTNKFGKKK